MSFGLTAALLLRLDSRRGDWLRVATLAMHCAIPEAAVAAELESMVASGLARVQRDGRGQVFEATSMLRSEA